MDGAMPIDYRYDGTSGLIEIRCFGELTIAEISRYFVDLAADERVPRGAIEMVDLEAVEDFSVSSAEASTMPDNYELAQREKAIVATILIAPNDANFGMARMIQAYFETNMPDHVFTVVRSRPDAETAARSIRAPALEESDG